VRLVRVDEYGADATPEARVREILEQVSVPSPSLPSAPESRPPPAPPDVAAAQQIAAGEPLPRRRLITVGRLSFLLVAALLVYGLSAHTERYITPTRGLGYALGIIGGSLMLIVLLYSLRKRWRWLEFLGSTPAWFNFHMVLGIAGPLCILFHSNFGTGATNSNVALFSMLAVAGSGVIGRYFYGHIHYGLHGRKIELRDLREEAERVRGGAGGISLTPELTSRLESAEQQLLNAGSRLWGSGYVKPLVVALATLRVRAQLHHYVRGVLPATADGAGRAQVRQDALAYVDRRLTATRRVAEFEGYERLFSLWHTLHIPMIFVMAMAAIVHVIAVNVY
jgi:hypothetical protein